jgi:hypothetical protein
MSTLYLPGTETPRFLDPHERIAAHPEQTRIRAISHILAAEASRHKDVVGYRATELQERLLVLGDVDGWVQDVAGREGQPSWWLSGVPVPAAGIRDERDGSVTIDHLGFTPQRGLDLHEVPSVHRRYLDYLTPQLLLMTNPISAGGVLNRLRLLSLVLEFLYFWLPADATTYVLTGLIPYAWRYADVLQQRRGRRPQGMSDKHMELAVFVSERPLGESLALKMNAWNALHPEWRYEQTSSFGGHSQLAIRRLIGSDSERPFDWTSRWGQDVAELGAHGHRELAFEETLPLLEKLLRSMVGQQGKGTA